MIGKVIVTMIDHIKQLLHTEHKTHLCNETLHTLQVVIVTTKGATVVTSVNVDMQLPHHLLIEHTTMRLVIDIWISKNEDNVLLQIH